MKITYKQYFIAVALVCAMAFATTAFAADAPKMKMTTPIPEEITTPDTVETRLGTLKFFDGTPDNGGIKSYEIYASTDGRDWGEPIVKGEFAPGPDLKLVAFPRPVKAKFLKLVALSGFDAQPFASLAEFEVER